MVVVAFEIIDRLPLNLHTHLHQGCLFLVVVEFEMIDRLPFKAAVYFIFVSFFVTQFDATNVGTVSPHVLLAQRASALTPPLPLLPTIGLIVV